MPTFSEYIHPSTRQALDGLLEKLRDDYQRIIITTGENRVGKSTLAQHIGDYVTPQLNSKHWVCYFFWSYPDEDNTINDIRRELGIENTNIWPASVQYAQEHGGLYDYIDVDEAAAFLLKSMHSSPEVEAFTVNVDLYGKNRYLYNILMPEFDFVKGFREGRTHLWLHIPVRGKVVFYKPFKTARRKYYDEKRPVWRDKFPELEPDRLATYNAVKDKMLQLRKTLRSRYSIKDYMMETLRRLKDYDQDITHDDISKVLGISRPTITRWINQDKRH